MSESQYKDRSMYLLKERTTPLYFCVLFMIIVSYFFTPMEKIKEVPVLYTLISCFFGISIIFVLTFTLTCIFSIRKSDLSLPEWLCKLIACHYMGFMVIVNLFSKNLPDLFYFINISLFFFYNAVILYRIVMEVMANYITLFAYLFYAINFVDRFGLYPLFIIGRDLDDDSANDSHEYYLESWCFNKNPKTWISIGLLKYFDGNSLTVNKTLVSIEIIEDMSIDLDKPFSSFSRKELELVLMQAV